MRRAARDAAIAAGAFALSSVPFGFAAFAFLGAALYFRAHFDDDDRPIALRSAFTVGFVLGFALNATELFWVTNLLTDYGYFPFILAVLTASLLWAAQALPFALASTMTVAMVRGGTPRILAFAACVALCTSLFPAIFPWHLAESQLPFLAFAQLAELGGEPLVDLVLLAIGAQSIVLLRQPTPGRMLALACSLMLPIAFGALRISDVESQRERAGNLRVGVVQPNVSVEDKRDRSLRPVHLQQLRRATAALEREHVDLVVWPETSYPFRLPRDMAREPEGDLALRPSQSRVPLLAGAITVGEGGRYNSVLALGGDGEVLAIADKVVLLVFGEYVPFYDFMPRALTDRFSRGLTPGASVEAVQIAGSRVGVLNCYEDVLSFFARRVTAAGPTWLVNVTNDAWFGDTLEPHLHHLAARYRAIETRRDLVRAVNTGVSAHVTATGADQHRTQTFVRDAFVADVRELEIITFWVRFGDLVTPGLLGVVLGALLAIKRRPRQGV